MQTIAHRTRMDVSTATQRRSAREESQCSRSFVQGAESRFIWLGSYHASSTSLISQVRSSATQKRGNYHQDAFARTGRPLQGTRGQEPDLFEVSFLQDSETSTVIPIYPCLEREAFHLELVNLASSKD